LPDINRAAGPSPYLDELLAAGKSGMKSGEGFRTWTPEQQAALRLRVLNHLKAMNVLDLQSKTSQPSATLQSK